MLRIASCGLLGGAVCRIGWALCRLAWVGWLRPLRLGGCDVVM
jgi:hypothetical protein